MCCKFSHLPPWSCVCSYKSKNSKNNRLLCILSDFAKILVDCIMQSYFYFFTTYFVGISMDSWQRDLQRLIQLHLRKVFVLFRVSEKEQVKNIEKVKHEVIKTSPWKNGNK